GPGIRQPERLEQGPVRVAPKGDDAAVRARGPRDLEAVADRQALVFGGAPLEKVRRGLEALEFVAAGHVHGGRAAATPAGGGRKNDAAVGRFRELLHTVVEIGAG